MQIDNLDDFDPGSEFEADIAIIGAGPAGITIAREFLNSPYRVLLIESGLVDEHEPHATLNHVESEGEPAGEATIRTKLCVLASGGIENARLLLASNRNRSEGLGNRHDIVGRFLMDHPGTRLGHFTRSDLKKADYLGFYTLRKDGHFRLYLHGLAFSPELQAAEKLLNAAKSAAPFADVLALITSVGLLSKAIGLKIFQSRLMPRFLQNPIINFFMVVNPGFVVREFQSKGVPHKLDCLSIHVMTEQQPDPESRIVLSDSRDRLGMPRAKAIWKISHADRHNILRIGQLLREELPKAGLPCPVMADWIVENRPDDAPLVDMSHATGSTRMSNDPKTGVVDINCQVHDVENLYVAGASVFPTSGHANPTLMITSLALRLADHLKARMSTLKPCVIGHFK